MIYLLYNLIRRKAESKRVWFTWKVMLSICLAIFKVRLSETGDLGWVGSVSCESGFWTTEK